MGLAGCDAILGISDHPVVADSGVRRDTGVGTGSGAGTDSGTGHSSSRDAGMDTRHDGGQAEGGGTCVPSAPDGWAGPFAIQIATAGDAGLPAFAQCPQTYDGNPVFDGVAEPDQTPASCGCSCDPPTGLGCPAGLSIFNDTACSMGQMSVPPSTTCMGLPGNIHSASVGSPVLVGNCQPSGNPVVPTPSWTEEARLCSPGTMLAACQGDRVVVPPPGAPYEATNYCVTSTTQTACPNAYQILHQLYPFTSGGSGLMDTRSCHCNCSGPLADAGCGAGTMAFYSFGGCTGTPQAVPTSTSCVALYESAGVEFMPAVPPTTTCAPSQVSTGMVTPMGMPTTTVCCLE